MVTTITTTTTTTVVMLQQAAVIAALGVVVLIASLVIKELFSSAGGKTRVSLLGSRLKIVILPLLFTFATILITKVWEVFQIGV